MAGTASDPFFWNDWQGDPCLRVCSLAAQGLWMRYLCIAADSAQKGFVLLAGKKPTPQKLSAIVGCPVDQLESLTEELIENGVASRDRRGVIFSRRMVRDRKKREASAKGGEKGGRVTYEKQKGIFAAQASTQEVTQETTQHPKDITSSFSSSSSKESSLRSDSPAEGSSKPRSPPSSKREPPEFSQWYDAFPRKAARGAAVKAFAAALRKASFDQLLEGAKRYAIARRNEDPNFTKYPATWLNQECWLDEDRPHQGMNGTGSKNGANPHPVEIEHTTAHGWFKRLEFFREHTEIAEAQRWRPEWGPPPEDPKTLVPRDVIANYPRPPAPQPVFSMEGQ